MRLHVPPRDVASLVILRAITRAGWAAAAVLLVATAVIVASVVGARGDTSLMTLPLAFLALQLLALELLIFRPAPRTAVIYIATSVVCIAGYQLTLLATQSELDPSTEFLLNRPIVALCAIGAATGTPIGGIKWSSCAFFLGEATSAVVLASLNLPLKLGVGPLVAYLLIVVLMLWIWGARRNQAKKVPDPRTVDAETQRLQEEQDAETRAAAVIHDTVLSDLAAIVHGRIALTEYDQDHLRRNVARLRSAMIGVPEEASPDSGAVDLELLALVSDLQWRGLSVELSGDGSALIALDESARSAAFGAIRAALENVLVHAGTASVDLFVDDNPVEVMIMVVDQGKGFDAAGVAADRLGLRLSIVQRIEKSGGRATVWSEPGVGTSVILSLPKPEGGP